MQRLRVGGVPEHFNAPWHYALHYDLFAQAGLALDFVDYPTGTGAMCADLVSGELDCAVLLTEGAVRHYDQHHAFQFIAPFITTPLVWGIYTGANRNLHTVADLRGKTFAISREGSGSHLMTQVLASQAGWKEPLSFYTAGKLDALCEAVQHTADAFLWEVFTTQPEVAAGRIKKLGELPTPWPCFFIVARNDIAAQPDLIQPMLKTLFSITPRFNRKSEPIAAFISQQTGLSLDAINTWLRTVQWATTTDIDADVLARARID